MEDIVLSAVEGTIVSMPASRRRDEERVRDAVRRAVRAAVDQAWGKKPIVKVPREVLELAAQLLVLEDLLERRCLELLDRLERGRGVPHQVAQLEARLHRLEGVVGDAQVVGGALARLATCSRCCIR